MIDPTLDLDRAGCRRGYTASQTRLLRSGVILLSGGGVELGYKPRVGFECSRILARCEIEVSVRVVVSSTRVDC